MLIDLNQQVHFLRDNIKKSVVEIGCVCVCVCVYVCSCVCVLCVCAH